MLRLFAPFALLPAAALSIAACAQVDAPAAPKAAAAHQPAILGADHPVFLGSMTVTALALPRD